MAIVVVALLAIPARAGSWPKPAAGPSQSGAPEVLFTFDDGPDERVTASVLDTLAKYEVQAVFFWNGRLVMKQKKRRRARRELVKRAVREGHLIANHTINHVHLCQVELDEARREIDANAAAFDELSGLPILLFRAPYGDKCKQLHTLLEERNLRHLHWDIDPQEFRTHDAAQTAGNVIQNIRNLDDGGRVVVLMHDTQPTTARALPRILAWIEQENLRRSRRGRPEIRILSGSDLIEERYDLPLVDWAESLAHAGRARLQSGIEALVPRPATAIAQPTR